MNRGDIKNRFREENPEITDRVITDTALNNWCIEGNLEIATETRAIKDEFTFTSVVDQFQYNLTSNVLTDQSVADTKFYDIDDDPGGGVEYDGKRIDKSSMSAIAELRNRWRYAASGTPTRWFLRSGELWFDKKSSAAKTVRVYTIQIAESFNDDNITPFNQLTFLEPYHPGIVKYLQYRAKQKIGDEKEGLRARQEYLEYRQDMKNAIQASDRSSIRFTNRTIFTRNRSR